MRSSTHPYAGTVNESEQFSRRMIGHDSATQEREMDVARGKDMASQIGDGVGARHALTETVPKLIIKLWGSTFRPCGWIGGIRVGIRGSS